MGSWRESRKPPKITGIKRKGSKKNNRKMTKQSHHNPERLDEEDITMHSVLTQHINESTVSSRRPFGPYQCSVSVEMEVKAKFFLCQRAIYITVCVPLISNW